ncbi:hypothetical protein [Brachybacterium sp. JB7]|uniref:hypothetical protein n=1 Tax=Brachybacterium sp. JB7 TaxID=2024478 RepID=UPI001F540077|nr:hypothetical protein [Brachybacterium sp. JB7]
MLDRWGWSSYLDIQATDTISAKGRAKEADVILTSGAIADTLGDVGVRVEVIENFTAQAEIDAVLRPRVTPCEGPPAPPARSSPHPPGARP